MNTIPANAGEITAEWLSAALKTKIAAVRVERIAEGMGVTTEIYRLHLSYPEGTNGPATLIAKLPSSIPEMRAVAAGYGLYEREVKFYRDIAGTLAMRTAQCSIAEFDPASQAFILVLEDLTNAIGADQVEGMSLEQVRLAIEHVAALHVRFWDKPELKALASVIQPFGVPPWREVGARHGAGWAVVRPFLAERLSPQMLRVGERMGAELDRVLSEASRGPLTICHGDFRADNLMFTRDGGRLGLITLDWQVSLQARGVFDIGYMMSASVTTELRREHEMALLKDYHQRLVAGGVEGYDFAECLEDYRRALLIGFTYCVQAGAASDLSHARTVALYDSFARRCDAAVQDLGLAEFVD